MTWLVGETHGLLLSYLVSLYVVGLAWSEICFEIDRVGLGTETCLRLFESTLNLSWVVNLYLNFVSQYNWEGKEFELKVKSIWNLRELCEWSFEANKSE